MYYDCGFHGYLHCFVLIICTMIVAFMGILNALLTVNSFSRFSFHRRVECFASVLLVFFGMFFLILLFSFKLSSFALNLFLFSYFLTGQNVENAQLTPQKYAHLRLHLRKCSCFSRHDRLCRTCVLIVRRIQASQTGRTKHPGSVNGSSRVSPTKVFVIFVGC